MIAVDGEVTVVLVARVMGVTSPLSGHKVAQTNKVCYVCGSIYCIPGVAPVIWDWPQPRSPADSTIAQLVLRAQHEAGLVPTRS